MTKKSKKINPDFYVINDSLSYNNIKANPSVGQNEKIEYET